MSDHHSTKSALTMRKTTGWTALLFLVILAALFAGYLAVSSSPLRDFFETAAHSTQSNGMTALDPVFYGVSGLAAFVLLLALFQFSNSLVRRFSKAKLLSKAPEKTLEGFVQEAHEAKISVRVARESYQLLARFYSSRMCIDLSHDLRDDLKLTDDDIFQLYAGLLSRTERRESRSAPLENIATVRDLLDYVERAPAQHLEGIGVRIRATDLPSVQRGIVSGSGMFIRDQTTGESRRSTDYVGPRRRASDNKIKRAYSGPHRRATDRLQFAQSAISGERSAIDSDKHGLVLVPTPKQPAN